jgi:hypothetical protein
MRENIPISLKQVLFVGLLFVMPILLAAIGTFGFPESHQSSKEELWFSTTVLIAAAIISIVVCRSMITRRSVELTEEYILVKHTFYTFQVHWRDIHSVTVSRTSDVPDLKISTKKNGIAAFGFYSGWFNADYGELVFLAISVPPILVIRFAGHPKCSAVALSCSSAMEAGIRAWASHEMSAER